MTDRWFKYTDALQDYKIVEWGRWLYIWGHNTVLYIKSMEKRIWNKRKEETLLQHKYVIYFIVS